MAYKLLDSNGNYMNINGMHKGTIVSPYVYNGMELYNENTIATNRYAFYSTYRRVYTGSGYVYPNGSTHYYTTEPYASTSIIINGRYSSSSYKNYEVYKDGNLVASGSYTSSTTNIYTCEKDANTSIIVSGMWDAENSKFIYNITTNATINRQNSYEWNNGIVTTSSIEMPKIYNAVAVTAQYIPKNITMPTRADIEAMLPSDCVVMSISSVSYLLTFTKSPNSNPEAYYNMWLRTSYNTTTLNPSTLPGSSVCSVTNVGYSSSKTYTLTGTSRLGATYYLYARTYNTTGTYQGNNYYSGVNCVATATVKYRYFDEVHTVTINVTRTNNYTLPKYTLANLISEIGLAGTVSISNFVYHVKIVDNFVSGTHYFKIFEGTTEQGSYGTLSGDGTWTTRNITYTADMTNTLVVKYSSTSTGTYNTNNYMAFSNVEGENYITVSYTWTPPA